MPLDTIKIENLGKKPIEFRIRWAYSPIFNLSIAPTSARLTRNSSTEVINFVLKMRGSVCHWSGPFYQ